MFCKAKSAKKTFFARRFLTIFKQKFSNLRPLLSILFPKDFWISKNIGHPTSGSGGKKTFKRYLKSEETDRQTDGQTNRRTIRLIESIGPEGQCFENLAYRRHWHSWRVRIVTHTLWNFVFLTISCTSWYFLASYLHFWHLKKLCVTSQITCHLPRVTFHLPPDTWCLPHYPQ